MTVFGTVGFLNTFGGVIMTKLDEFIEKAKRIHYGEDLDYSRAVYINNRTPLCIIDHDLMDDGKTEYGEYWQTPYNHLRGQSHPLKRGNKISRNKSSKQEDIIRRFNEAHKGENLDYSKVVYKNMHTKVCIIDPEFGEYWQEPAAHLKGCGHPMRGRRQTNDSIKHLPIEKFIDRSKTVHNGKYSYDNINKDFLTYRENVPIICPKHGEFFQTVENHLAGKGCPKCGNHYSKYEDEICNYLRSIDSSLIIEQHNRTILDGKEIDIYFPQKKIGIEFNGLRWHTEWFGKREPDYHLKKTEECNSKGIGLIQIFEDEYVNKKQLVLNKIKHILNI